MWAFPGVGAEGEEEVGGGADGGELDSLRREGTEARAEVGLRIVRERVLVR